MPMFLYVYIYAVMERVTNIIVCVGFTVMRRVLITWATGQQDSLWS